MNVDTLTMLERKLKVMTVSDPPPPEVINFTAMRPLRSVLPENAHPESRAWQQACSEDQVLYSGRILSSAGTASLHAVSIKTDWRSAKGLGSNALSGRGVPDYAGIFSEFTRDFANG